MSPRPTLPQIFPRPRIVATGEPALRDDMPAEVVDAAIQRRYTALKHDILRRIQADLTLIDCLERAELIDLRSKALIDG